MGFSGSIDVSADRIVIWTGAGQGIISGGTTVQAANAPLEMYMEGNIVFREGGGNGGLHAEATAQSSGDIIFSAAFPDFEFAGGANASLAGIESEHDFAEGEHIVGAGAGSLHIQRGHGDEE